MVVFTDGNTISNFGFKIEVQFTDSNNNPIDISGATTKKITFVPPTGVAVLKDASFTTNGQDGKIFYLVESGLFVAPGEWKFYGIAKAASFDKSTQSDKITVYKAIGLI